MAHSILVIGSKRKARILKPSHKLLGLFLEERWNSIIRNAATGRILEYTISTEDWNKIRKEVGFRGPSVDICISRASNVIVRLKEDGNDS